MYLQLLSYALGERQLIPWSLFPPTVNLYNHPSHFIFNCLQTLAISWEPLDQQKWFTCQNLQFMFYTRKSTRQFVKCNWKCSSPQPPIRYWIKKLRNFVKIANCYIKELLTRRLLEKQALSEWCSIGLRFTSRTRQCRTRTSLQLITKLHSKRQGIEK